MPDARIIPLDPSAHRAAPDAVGEEEGFLDFLRRRLTGDYTVDDFGFDADLTDHVLIPPLRPLYERWFRVRCGGSTTCRRQAGRSSSPTTRGRSHSTR